MCSVYTIQPCTMSRHAKPLYACYIVLSCNLPPALLAKRLDLLVLHAGAVTQGLNGCWNKSQHRKLILETKKFLLLLQGFEPATFQSWIQHSNHWAIPTPLACSVTMLNHVYLGFQKQVISFSSLAPCQTLSLGLGPKSVAEAPRSVKVSLNFNSNWSSTNYLSDPGLSLTPVWLWYIDEWWQEHRYIMFVPFGMSVLW